MKKATGISILLCTALILGCATKKGSATSNRKSFVDMETPTSTRPLILLDSNATKTSKTRWKLVFSDEFNDNIIDTTKWNIGDHPKKRKDVMVASTKEQLEEKDGKIFLYYQKSKINDTTYLAGRFNSKNKFSLKYGYYETRIHLVKPNGYQTAFWLMPNSNGMSNDNSPDGTANDGAEVDIVEGNKLNAFSTGLHWDGYAKGVHKGKGKVIKDPNIHDTEYHTFGFEWTPTYLKWYYDGKQVRMETDAHLIPQVAHYVLITGSCFGENDWLNGDVRKNEMIQNGGIDKGYVDYVRVFEFKN